MTVDLSWPNTIPLPSIDGYQLKPKPNVIGTEMDVGPARARRRSTRGPTEIPVQFKLTLWQQMLFESWYVNRAMEGTAWFNVDLLGGMGITPHEARFKGDVAYRPLSGQRWIATATLLVRDRPMLTDADLALLLPEPPDTLFAAINGIHHVTTYELWTS